MQAPRVHLVEDRLSFVTDLATCPENVTNFRNLGLPGRCIHRTRQAGTANALEVVFMVGYGTVQFQDISVYLDM